MTPSFRSHSPQRGDLCLVALLALSAAVAWVLAKGPFLSGDEAVVGLMALKISQGLDFPIFFWGAHYGGPLASYLSAPLHLFLKPSFALVQSPAVLFHVLYSCGIFLLAGRWLGERAALAAGLYACLPFDLFPYASVLGYTETLCFTPWLFLICGVGDRAGGSISRARIALAGLLSGFALWISPLSVPAVCVSLVHIKWRYRSKALGTMLLFAGIGLLPPLVYNLNNPGASFLRLLARPASMDKSTFLAITAEQGLPSLVLHILRNWAGACLASLRDVPEFTLQLFRLTPDANGCTLAAGIAAFLAFLFSLWAGSSGKREHRRLPAATPALALCTYAYTILFGLDRHRYLIPVLFLVPFGWAMIIERIRLFISRPVSGALLGILLVVNAFSNFRGDGHTQTSCLELVRHLEDRGLHRGYADYDITYPIVYLSNERLIYTPFFHTPQYDRYATYTDAVKRSERPAFLFSIEHNAHRFRQALQENFVSCREETWESIALFHSIAPGIDIQRLKLNLIE